MRFSLVSSALALTLALALSACSSSDSSGTATFGSRFVDRSRGQALTSQEAAPQSIEGLYFGELEMVAYDYRPGQGVQASGGFGNGSPSDWSYWVALQNGHDAGRDNVLKVGEQIDFAAMNGDYARPLEQDFIDQVGRFEIDFFEVYMYRTGVVRDGEYYGMNAEQNGHDKHPLHKYPAWATLPDHFCSPEFPGVPAGGQDVNVFFARSDWFPQPVTVRMGSQTPAGATIESSSVTLTQDQQDKLLSLVNQGTMRRFYQDLVVIPFAGPILVDLKNEQSSAQPESGAAHVINQGDLQVTVSFDLTDVIDPATDWSVPRVVYKGDANDVPFGLSVSFDAVP